MKNRQYWNVGVCLVTWGLLAQASAQSTRDVCSDALMDRVSSSSRSTAVILLESARIYAISSFEEGFRGTGSLRINGRSTRPLTFDCRVDTRSGRVTGLDVEESPGTGFRLPRPVAPPQPGVGSVGDSSCQVPTLYADDSLRGESLPVERSVYDLNDQNFGDEASSLCVPDGWRVVLYSDDAYGGEQLSVSGPREIQDLKRDRPEGQDWGDRISSIEVLRVQPDASLPASCGSVPTLYSDDGFEGRSLQVKDSIADLHGQGFGDRASSVCVPAGWVVELFSDTGYRGDRLSLRGPVVVSDLKRDQPEGQDWGDRISSVRISSAGYR